LDVFDIEINLNDNERGIQSPEEEIMSATAPRLTSVLAQGNPDFDIPTCLQGRYTDDPFFQLVVSNPDHYTNFEIKDGLIFLKDSGRRIFCIPDIKIGGRNVRELVISQAHSILAHLGARKTVYYLKDNVWWKDMVTDMPYGLLQPLEVPSHPWEIIGIDFVGPLPESKTQSGSFAAVY
ncbi:hypothetical protein EVG20_g6704, partial [Dentipellis fragilis]